LGDDHRRKILHHFRSAKRRVLFLDYDGTLVPFAPAPWQACPDPELLKLLTKLGSDPLNELVLISGRPKRDLETWFRSLPLGMVAEQGVWLCPKGAQWHMLKNITAEWKESVRPILQLYVDRLPGAFLEEKDFSLTWHYRRADPEQASIRAKELLDDLANYTRNIEVQVLEGKKVVEIRNSGVNKGGAAVEWLNQAPPDFILAIGDDWTDEDLFRALPPTAYSVRVGLGGTLARYYLHDHVAVRELLIELSASVDEQTDNGGPRQNLKARTESLAVGRPSFECGSQSALASDRSGYKAAEI